MDTYPDTDLESAIRIIAALDSRLRIQIVLRLDEREHFVHELVSELQKSQPLVSQHLRVLKESGIVDAQRQGRQVVYRLAQPGAREIVNLAANIGGRPLRKLTLVGGTDLPREDERSPATAAVVLPPEDHDTIPNPSPAPPAGQSPVSPPRKH